MRTLETGTELRMSVIRILVVDDSSCCQEFVDRALAQALSVRIIGTAYNGLEAVRKVGELQPDLVSLDLSLPRIDGIEVARRIQEVAANSAILFVSAEADSEVVRAALDGGGRGDVLKTSASSDLLPGIPAVAGGEKFVSRGLIDYH
ncbi:MAG TPA: response regulator transcription factor [Dongiaceae bacterium]|nr:response regulator transcription factor [Dongiaceae bacterium]